MSQAEAGAKEEAANLTGLEPLVLSCGELGWPPLRALLERYGLELEVVAEGVEIPGSFWGDAEAGLLGRKVLARDDTPVHSLLHEMCHLVCMDENRRENLDTNAGGEDVEENAVCYLQILLADHLPGTSKERQMLDMDRWGYSFRLGSTRAWFEEDASDARRWLEEHGLLGASGEVVFTLRR